MHAGMRAKMYVCVCIVYVCAQECVRVYVRACVGACVLAHAPVRVRACVCVCVYARARVCVCLFFKMVEQLESELVGVLSPVK